MALKSIKYNSITSLPKDTERIEVSYYCLLFDPIGTKEDYTD